METRVRLRRRIRWFPRISVKQVNGYGLTTAHILYRRPDHRWLLQSYVWQAYDLFPEFPELHASWRSGRRSWKARCIRCRSRIAS